MYFGGVYPKIQENYGDRVRDHVVLCMIMTSGVRDYCELCVKLQQTLEGCVQCGVDVLGASAKVRTLC